MGAHLRMTDRRLHLLREVQADRVFRDGAGQDYISGERQVTAEIGSLAAAGLVELATGPNLRPWKLTALGRGHLAVRVMDYGDHVVIETGPEDDVTIVADMRLEVATGPRRLVWRITGHAAHGEPFRIPSRAGREHARQVLRHLAAQAIAADLAEATR